MTASVSIVLASFRSPWLSEAVASVLAQRLGDWELLVLDDANDRTTEDVVRGLRDPRVRYLANSRPLGPALNHQRGIDEARHDLVAFVNHDDVWEPTLLARLVPVISRHPEAILSFADHSVIREDGSIDYEGSDRCSSAFGRAGLTEGLHQPFAELAVVHKAIPVAQAAVMRKAALPRIPHWVGGAYDFYIATRLAATGQGAVYVAERLARFREHATNLGLRRSPLRDLASVGIYAGAAMTLHGRARQHAAREAARCLTMVPRSMVRALQAGL